MADKTNNRLNILNMSTQSSNTSIYYASDKANALVRKLDLVISLLSKDHFSTFKILDKFWKDKKFQSN